jgi:predicted Zn-ribbon and HTH transcriptional regulator
MSADMESKPFQREEVVKIKVMICQKCGHEWTPAKNKFPRRCPHCFRFDWTEPRKK